MRRKKTKKRAAHPVPRVGTVVGILQNSWAHNPKATADVLARTAIKPRARLHRFMIVRSRTGQVLKAAMGADLFDAIEWYNSTAEITAHPRARVCGDPDHVAAIIAEWQPDAVLALGRVAGDTIRRLADEMRPINCPVLFGPHPTSRGTDVAPELSALAARLRPIVWGDPACK